MKSIPIFYRPGHLAFAARLVFLFLAGVAVLASLAGPAVAEEDFASMTAQRRYQFSLEQWVLAHKPDPAVVSANKWSGNATFTVRVNERGEVSDIKVTQSSGDAATDSEALSIVRGAAAETETPKALLGSAYQTSVAIVFNLAPTAPQFQSKSPRAPGRDAVGYAVDAGQEVSPAVVRRVIEPIREHYKGDFTFESKRLHKVVILSARVEDDAALESFLLREFGVQTPVRPAQAEGARTTE